MFLPTAKQDEALDMLGKSRMTLLFGGSRSGKTFVIVYKIVTRALIEDKSRHCILRKFFVDCNKAIVNDTFPKVMSICYPGIPYTLNKQLFYAQLPNESQIWFGGLDKGDKILGNEYATMYFNECSELSYDTIETAYSRNAQKCKKIKNRFYFDENPVGKSHWSYRLFVKGLNPVDNSRVPDPENYSSMRMNPMDNEENLSETYLLTLNSMSQKKRARFRDGEWQDDSENALWKRESMISAYRVTSYPFLERVVIGVDPAVTNTEKSDETGMVCVGCAKNAQTNETHYYVLADWSMKGSPDEWASRVCEFCKEYEADRVVVEVNNGGDLVESILRRINPSIPLTSVRATRGKILRAEPISALYERGLVHHVEEFQLLEDEMCNYCGTDKESSPDRLDALVWALTELSEGNTEVSIGETSGFFG